MKGIRRIPEIDPTTDIVPCRSAKFFVGMLHIPRTLQISTMVVQGTICLVNKRPRQDQILELGNPIDMSCILFDKGLDMVLDVQTDQHNKVQA